MRVFTAGAIVFAAVFGGAGAMAADPPASDQISQPVAEAEPFYIPYGEPIRLDAAIKVVTAALTEAAKHHWHLACAVVEPTGDLVAFEKMDDTQYGSVDVALGKAKTAARFRRSIKAFSDAVKGGNIPIMSLPGVVAGEGSFPIVKAGKMIGAIGCSGAASNQDATAAYAAAQSVQ